MANGWGGRRAGAGRKPGTRNASQRVRAARARWRAEKIDANTDAISRARSWIETHEDAILDTILESGDPKLLLEVWKQMKLYGDGAPKQRIELSTGPSPSEILMEIAERRRLAIPAEVVPDA
jgi:hypothetical protein